ncbi:class I SAM-dependent methyltransferase [Streptomyces sp. NPDC048269]|uniref:class I SAM-dependent methyltransferase n=1 Tax=Streptomyces sp. NPDC048269 TaxID=3155753 RepID=UPI00341705D2
MSAPITPYAGASATALAAHYDLPTAFYALWLDRSLTYSCALWDGAEDDLASAQSRKIDYLIEQARAPHTGHVLDIGCGWGSTLNRLVRHHHVQHATGLNLSPLQCHWVQQQKIDGVTVLNENWRDHHPTEPYDAIVSIGAFEHFARMGMSDAARLDAYRTFFAHCRTWLRPSGRLALQTIAWGPELPAGAHTFQNALIPESVFRESSVPFLAEIEEAMDGLFRIVHMRNDGDHYERTCSVWHRNLQDRRSEAVRLVGTEAVERYEQYLDLAARLFRRRWTTLLRLTLETRA